MKLGQYVEWNTNSSKDGAIARAGKIVAIVPPYMHPNEVYPGNYFNPSNLLRQDESYIVWIPKYNTVMWPSVKLLKPLMRSRAFILDSQPKPSLRVKTLIDRSDRRRLTQLAHALGDVFVETADSLSVPIWGRKFIFETVNNVEAIKEILDI